MPFTFHHRINGLQSLFSIHPMVSAIFRWASYLQLKAFRKFIPALGPLLLIISFWIFSVAVCVLPRPFYRSPKFRDSALSLRAGWIATAMVPWAYATATKRNILVYISGVSYHRILTLHKSIPWICLFMSILHAFTKFIKVNRQKPWWHTVKTDPHFLSGLLALIALAWLCVMSLGQVRNRFYETFYFLHMLFAVVFLVWTYIHLNNASKAWQYIHPTTVIWSAAILWQFLVHANDHGWFKKIPRASVESLGPKAFRISISMPNKRTWGAGSYVYLRFLSIRPWESHPFTISSLPGTSVQEEHEESGQSGINQMVFLIRPQTGLTERLHNLLMASQGQLMCSCLVDGPYDGFMNKLRACDSVVLLAGGRGMVAIIPVAQALQRASGEIGISCCKNIKVVWSFKELSALTFFKFQLDEVKGFVSAYNTGNADLKTGFTTESFNYENDVSQQCLTPEDCFDKLERGRPNIQLIIEHAAKKFSGRLGILGKLNHCIMYLGLKF
ncbi:expressed protein [Phakopsora pachyrhizi]|uniref:Expressed protein n=1 Tax=Phakopsora pachyrhizi TaxID=170000 RepID=A0AAV0AJ16_PHAPC|nr:expressed protein [Phakopsora pachyrhizi]